jgi:murein DD-endopeptidase MepM/ murein hydrolase activator NlpD
MPTAPLRRTVAVLATAALVSTGATALGLPAFGSGTPTPTPTPTQQPTETPEPSPTATPQPSPTPTPDPPSTGTASDATAPGLPPPSLDLGRPVVTEAPTSTGTSDELLGRLSSGQQGKPLPGAAQATEGLAEAAAAVLAAQQALQSAETQLAAVRARLVEAEQTRTAAQAVRDEAARKAAAAKVAETQAARALDAKVDDLDEQRDLLGALARQAYRTGGPFSSLSVVLESSTPQEFASNLRAVEAVLRSEDVVIAALAAELAELAEVEARRTAAREERERAEAVAERALDLATQAEQTAALVEKETQSLVTAREQALATAQRAQAEDLEKYRGQVMASQAVGYSLVAWSDALARSGTVQGTGSFARPGYGSPTSPFGMRIHPIFGSAHLHGGADYGIGDGGIYAADSGMVVLAGYNASYGNMTVISHGRIGSSSLATLYAHQSRIIVRPGDVVQKGQLIGLVGSTGNSTGPHLHFEVRVNGTPVDPEPWLVGAPTPAQALAAS